MARLKAFALQTKAARISSSPQKSADFRGPHKGLGNGSAKAVTLGPEAHRISSSPQKSADFRGPRKEKKANG